jgi:hypothetical protein
MRAIIGVVAVLAALWSGYWAVGSRLMQGAVAGWFDAQTAQGVLAEHEAISVSGFPNRFDLTVTAPRLQDPARGVVWQAPFLQGFMMTWKPWHLIAAFPPTQTLDLQGQQIVLQNGKTQASLVLLPGTDLGLDRITLVSESPVLTSSLGWTVEAREVRFATRRDAGLSNGQELGLEVTGLAPDPRLRAAIPDLPPTLEVLRLDLAAALSAPLDRNVAVTRPAVERLVIRSASLQWGPIRAELTGDLAADASGLAEGRMTLELTNGSALVPIAVAAGLVSAEVGETLAGMITRMQATAGANGALNLPLVLRGGVMRFGLIPLGPAPRLNYRQ